MNVLALYQRILAIAQNGQTFGKDPFDQERYQELERIAITLMSQLSDHPIESIVDLFTSEQGYATPKVDVRAVITKNNQVLLVQDTLTKEWSLPGGFAEVGLSPIENIQLEVFEETGLEVAVGSLLAVFDTQQTNSPQTFQFYKLVFACEVLGGHFQINHETSQAAYFSWENLPPLSQKRTTLEQLHILQSLENNIHIDGGRVNANKSPND